MTSRNITAIRGKIGSTEYYLATMKIGEFIRAAIIPKDMEGWEDQTVEERFQRDINYKRVKDHIAPYLANDPDRFIGSFIVTIKNHEDMVFESLAQSGINIPRALGDFSKDVGHLILSGDEIIIPLDGQHRLAALKFAMTGLDQKDQPIKGISGNTELSKETISLIMIKDDPAKSRKIFNKVNRYAKPTSKADNLITADDDVVAVINRDLVINDLMVSRVVKTSVGNTLTDKDGFFTTIATTYEICLRIIEEEIGGKVNTQVLPSPDDVILYQTYVKEFWENFLRISPYNDSLIDTSEEGDDGRAEIRKDQIICKPIVMRALAEAILTLRTPKGDSGRMAWDECIRRIELVDWKYDNNLWNGILLQGGKIIAGTPSMKLASRFIAYLLGDELDDFELEDLKNKYRSITGGTPNGQGGFTGGNELPDRVIN